MIECRDLTVSYGKKEILKNISFTAGSGEFIVILGKNGCGKTTLLRALCGTLPYKGSIILNGIESSTLNASRRAALISAMPQMLHSPSITVAELVSFGRQPYTGITGILSENDRQIVKASLIKTGLDDFASKRLNCLSGGERQKAYFALLLAQDTPTLLLDEPSSHLDAAYIKDLMYLLNEEKAEGKTILAVLHDINQALAYADRLIVLRSGGILFNGTPEEFCCSTIPEDIFNLKKYICSDPNDPDFRKICYLQ